MAAKYGIKQGSSAGPSTNTEAENAVQQAAVEVADAAVHAEVPAGPNVALAQSAQDMIDNSADTGAAPVANGLSGESLPLYSVRMCCDSLVRPVATAVTL